MAQITITVTDDAGVAVSAQIAGIAVTEGLASMRRWMETQRVLVPPAVPVDPQPPVPEDPPIPEPVFAPMYANEAQMVLSHTAKLLHVLIEESPDAATKAELEDIAARTAVVVAKRKLFLDALV